MRILGIDYGDSRIGIAISDDFGMIARGLETIHWKESLSKPIARIKSIINEYNIISVIVGFPINMNGTVGERGEKTLLFIDLLKKEIPNINITKWDERLSTVSAHKTMIEMGVKAKNKKGIVDQIAASYILQNFLDSSQNKQ